VPAQEGCDELLPRPAPPPWRGQIVSRFEVVDAPVHTEDLDRYRVRGYRVAGNRIAVVTDYPRDLVEVHPPSREKVDLGGLTVERCRPRPGTTVPGARNRDRAVDEKVTGVLKDPPVAGNGFEKSIGETGPATCEMVL